MDIVEKFIRQISYKFPKGYPDMNNEQDVVLLNSLLEDLDPTIKDLTGKQKGPSKLQTFTELSNLTYKQYKSNLGKITDIFPNTVNTIENWKSYVDKDLSNKGVLVENSIKNYIIAQNKGVEVKEISKGKGEDLMIDGKIVEVKSMQDDKINTQLQTSFYVNDPNKFYIFVSKTSSPDIDLRIVSSQLLYRAALGDEIVDEIEAKKGEGSDILSQQLENGLKTLDVKKFIMSSLLTGKTSEGSKSFFIGKDDNIRVRFVIYIEPK
jgi:hypothetical protein